MKSRREKRDAQEMDLLPVMNLMVTLIPFLLLGAAFFKLGNIPTSIPDNVPASDSPPPTEIKVTMNCEIDANKVTLSGGAAGLDEAATDAMSAVFANKGGQRDLKGISDHLARIKSQYPKSDTVMVLPSDTTKYQDLVVILDTMRERKLPGLTADGEQRTAALFPVTVFSRRITEADVPVDSEEGEAE